MNTALLQPLESNIHIRLIDLFDLRQIVVARTEIDHFLVFRDAAILKPETTPKMLSGCVIVSIRSAASLTEE